jgi:multidrug resistance efflux pump
MESTEKKRQGKNVVIGILLLATLGAGLTWTRYTAQSPSTKDARLVSDRVVLATFSAHAARNIREGTKAIVTVESSSGKRLLGTVQSLQTADQETTAVIFLKEPPQNAQPQTPCHVTVDTSVAREALKAD